MIIINKKHAEFLMLENRKKWFNNSKVDTENKHPWKLII